MAKYKNQGGLLINPDSNECAGYIIDFSGHGVYQPTGKVETEQGPSKAEIDAHNAMLAKAELDHMIKMGKGTLYLSYDHPKCSPENPRWQQENAGTWHYSNYRVSNWVGRWKAPYVYVKRGYSYGFTRVETMWVWFTGPDGKRWYGVRKGDMDCFNARRLKEPKTTK